MWLKRLFCKHDFIVISEVYNTRNVNKIRVSACHKCGKLEAKIIGIAK